MGVATNEQTNIADDKESFLAKFEKQLGFPTRIKWDTTIFFIFMHVFGPYWCYHYAFPAKWQTLVFACAMYTFSMMGIAIGIHRFWSHKTFKAKLPLKILLMLAFASTGLYSIYGWVRDHRLHHKFNETEADPNNPSRGFFFAHTGCYLLKKNSIVLEKGRQTDMSDILQDPVAVFERKYTIMIRLMCAFVIPTLTGILLWDEDWRCAVAWQSLIRVIAVYHGLMSINSIAHLFGNRPYNKNILAAENWFISLITLGTEGAHNYHHTFPNDYKSAATNNYLSLSTILIRIFAKMGLAYDLKEPSPSLVRAILEKQKLKE